MRSSPLIFWNFKIPFGSKLNPVPPAYDNGPWQGNTTTAQEKIARIPEALSLSGGCGCVKDVETEIKELGSRNGKPRKIGSEIHRTKAYIRRSAEGE